jgi:hypothetical protein
MYTMAEKLRSAYTAIMWWPGVTFSLAGSNRTNTRSQVGLGISGADIKFLLANSPLHTKRAAEFNNMAQKSDLGEKKGEEKKIWREKQYMSLCLLQH